MAEMKRVSIGGADPKPSSPVVPIVIAVVLVGASLAALYYAGFFSPAAKSFVCWDQKVVDSPGKCAAQPTQYCPSPTACPAAPTPTVVTSEEVKTPTQVGKQAIIAPVFKVVDFKASGGILSLMLEYNEKPSRASWIGISGITTTNDTYAVRPTGNWLNSTTLMNVGDRTPWLNIPDSSLARQKVGDAFSLTVAIYYGGGLVEQWVLSGKVE